MNQEKYVNMEIIKMNSGYRPWDSRNQSFIIGNENQSHIKRYDLPTHSNVS
ncbi:hypothetical protein [Paenibacillus illinoisensis]|uniref:hypothetical protein n=1 Tax=Paenibacillus illinoisensis TaxID=59845 RepID=UPI00301C1DEC